MSEPAAKRQKTTSEGTGKVTKPAKQSGGGQNVKKVELNASGRPMRQKAKESEALRRKAMASLNDFKPYYKLYQNAMDREEEPPKPPKSIDNQVLIYLLENYHLLIAPDDSDEESSEQSSVTESEFSETDFIA